MLNICITFDYELWLDDVIPEEENHLFKATDALLKMLHDEGVSATFFADTCSVQIHKRYNRLNYVSRFEEQIKRAARYGHDIELHLHPSWYRCKYDSNIERWLMTYDGYFVQDYGFDEKKEISAQAIVRENKEYLEALIKSVDSNYKCVAYRAGGFGICPEEDLCKVLRNEGIWIDSSVALEQIDFVNRSYDYRKFPKRINWWFEPNNGLKNAISKNEQAFYEIAIGYGFNNPIKYLGLSPKKLRVCYQERNKKIEALENDKRTMINKLNCLKRHFAGKGILSLDTRGADVLMRDMKENFRRYHCREKDAYIAIICHPKMASENTINNMERFIKMVKKDSSNFMFTTIKKAGIMALENRG